MQELEAVTMEDHPGHTGLLNSLGSHLINQSKPPTGDSQGLERATAQSEATEVVTPEGHDQASLLGTVENHLDSQYEHTRNLQDVDHAIALAEDAVEPTPAHSHPDQTGQLTNLADTEGYVHGQYVRFRNLEDAIAQSQAELDPEATSEDHPDRARVLHNLALYLHIRHEQTGNSQDLEDSVALSKAALEATPEDHPDWAVRLSSFGAFAGCGCGTTGNMEDLEHAIAKLSMEAAVERTYTIRPTDANPHWDMNHPGIEQCSMTVCAIPNQMRSNSRYRF